MPDEVRTGLVLIVWSAGATSSGPDRVFVSVGASTAHAAQSEDLVAPLAGYTAGDFRGTGARELATAAAGSDSGYSPGQLLVFDMASRRLVRHAGLVDSFTMTTHAVGAQLDGDAALEICVLEGVTKGCYDGLDLSEQWRSELARNPTSLAVAELDGTAFPEIVHGTDDGYVVAQEGESGWLKWQTPDFEPELGTFDRIAVLPASNPNDTRIVVATGSESEVDSQVTLVSAAGSVVAGPWDVSVTSLEAVGPGPELWIGTPAGDVAPMNPVDGQVGAPAATFPAPVQAFARGDLDADGLPEIVAAGGGRLWIHDGATHAIVWTSPFLGDSSHHADTLLLGDVDGDDGQEIVVSTRFGFAVFSGPQGEIFRDSFETGDTWRWTFTVP